MKVQIEILGGLLRYSDFGGFWDKMATFKAKCASGSTELRSHFLSAV